MAEFIHPNWHIILIHYPLGLFVVGVLIELFSFLWPRSGFRAAGRWMILIGALSTLPTLMTGLYALVDVLKMTGPTEGQATWYAMQASSQLSQEQWWMLQWHLWLAIASSAVAVVVVVVWLGCSDHLRRRLHAPSLVLLLISLGLMVSGAWFSGETVYRHGTAVVAERADSEPPASGEPENMMEYLAPPIQLHVTLVGFALAMALAAVGLSYRASAVAIETERRIDAETSAPPTTQVDSLMRSLGADAVDAEVHRFVPAPRFWILAALLFVLTAASGIWFFASEYDTWQPAELWSYLTQDDEIGRQLVHVILGSSIIVLTLILAAIARWSPRHRGVLTIATALLAVVVAAQFWMGILLLYDSPDGPLTRLNARDVETQTSQVSED